MKNKAISLILAMLFIAPMLAITIHPAYASPSTMSILNPGPSTWSGKWTAGPDVADQGTNNFNFTTADTVTGDTFFLNITIADVQNMKAWGIGLVYENATLQYMSSRRPPDHVFEPVEGFGWTLVAPAVSNDEVDATHRILKWGCAYIMGDPVWSFSGSGVLCQFQFKILASVDRVNNKVTAVFTLSPDWTAVFFYPSGSEVPTLNAGYFKYEWLEPTTHPDFFVNPAIYKSDTLKMGDDVAIEVWMKDLDPAWSVVAIEVGLMFNLSCLNCTGMSYEANTAWMSTFVNDPETGPIVGAWCDFEDRPDLKALGYGMWLGAMFIVPGPGPVFVPPFPSVGLVGVRLFTFHLKAMCETLFPLEEYRELNLTDILVYDAFGLQVGTSEPVNGTFRCPIKKLGLNIDLYSCRDGVLQDNGLWVLPVPDGIGPNNPTDMYQPQAEVDLQALVTYNEWPVQQKLVAFEVHSPTGLIDIIYRENYTDVGGVAWVKFRIPWPCVDPWDSVFGVWTVIATVEVAKQIVNDTMQFKVGWPIKIENVTGIDVTIDKYQPTPMKFTVWYSTQRMNPNLPLFLTVDAYDELGFHIGSAIKVGNLSDYTGALPWCTTFYFSETFNLPTPTNAVVGQATVYADAFNYAPWYGGVPWCPEVSGTFNIKKP